MITNISRIYANNLYTSEFNDNNALTVAVLLSLGKEDINIKYLKTTRMCGRKFIRRIRQSDATDANTHACYH